MCSLAWPPTLKAGGLTAPTRYSSNACFLLHAAHTHCWLVACRAAPHLFSAQPSDRARPLNPHALRAAFATEQPAASSGRLLLPRPAATPSHRPVRRPAPIAMADLKGKVALVTGATSGLGLETAAALAGGRGGCSIQLARKGPTL